MKSLLIKDFYVITKQLRLYLLIIPVMALIAGGTMNVFGILLGAVLPMTAIAYDERSKWNELAAMMPYTSLDLILSKYVLGYLCMLGAAILVVIGQFIGKFTGAVTLEDSQNLLLFAIVFGLVFIAINTPILFKFGSEKGRFVFIITMALIGASGPLLEKIDDKLLVDLLNVSPFILLLGAVSLNVISVMLSLRIRNNRE